MDGDKANYRNNLTRQAINRVVLNDIEITDPTSIANAFNNYFANIGSDLASAIPNVNNSAYEWMSPPPRDSFFLSLLLLRK